MSAAPCPFPAAIPATRFSALSPSVAGGARRLAPATAPALLPLRRRRSQGPVPPAPTGTTSICRVPIASRAGHQALNADVKIGCVSCASTDGQSGGPIWRAICVVAPRALPAHRSPPPAPRAPVARLVGIDGVRRLLAHRARESGLLSLISFPSHPLPGGTRRSTRASSGRRSARRRTRRSTTTSRSGSRRSAAAGRTRRRGLARRRRGPGCS